MDADLDTETERDRLGLPTQPHAEEQAVLNANDEGIQAVFRDVTAWSGFDAGVITVFARMDSTLARLKSSSSIL